MAKTPPTHDPMMIPVLTFRLELVEFALDAIVEEGGVLSELNSEVGPEGTTVTVTIVPLTILVVVETFLGVLLEFIMLERAETPPVVVEDLGETDVTTVVVIGVGVGVGDGGGCGGGSLPTTI